MQATSVVEANSVTFSYGNLQVLNGLSFSVREGEIFGVLGANGSGKTTLMRIMVGLLRNDGGTITVFGEFPSPRYAAQIGYMLGFLIFAIVQTVVILLFTIFALSIEYVGSLWEIGVVLFLLVTVAVSLGIFISSFANNEFQVVQFIPIVLAPQIFLSGVIIPVEQMPALFEWLSVVIPLTYAVDALREIMLLGTDLTTLWLNLAVIAAFSVALLAAAVATLRR